MKKFCFLLLVICWMITTSSAQLNPKPMSNARMELVIKRNAEILKGQLGFWQINFQERLLIIITDERHNRMRIMTPIIEVKDIKKAKSVLPILLEANYDRALDAKYAIDRGVLYSVFTHPLGELQDDQFLDAMKQVKALADNYGTSYTSSDLVFGGGE